MRILLATPYLFPEGGGLERYAHALAAHLAANGHHVVQVGFADAPGEEERDGVRRVRVPFASRVSNTPMGAGVYRAARRLLRAEPFDVVNGHAPVPGAMEQAALAAWRGGTPFVATYHAGLLMGGTPLLDALAWTHRHTLERWALGVARERIAVSSVVAARALRARATALVPPGVDVARFDDRGEPPEPGRVLYVGPVDRAYAWKGFDTLFRAFASLAPRRAEARLRVVGRGGLVDEYRERARRLGLTPRVSFAGRVDDDALAREYRQAAVVALPSLTQAESFGMVLAEANACGRPVVASRVGGIPEFVVDGENGLLVPPGDVDALASALLRVLDDPGLAARLGRGGVARVRREHRWPALAARTLEVYARACGRPDLTAAFGRAARRSAA